MVLPTISLRPSYYSYRIISLSWAEEKYIIPMLSYVLVLFAYRISVQPMGPVSVYDPQRQAFR